VIVENFVFLDPGEGARDGAGEEVDEEAAAVDAAV